MLEAAENILPFGRSVDSKSADAPMTACIDNGNDAASVDISMLTKHVLALLPDKVHPLYAPAQHHFAAPGKMLRSRVCLAACLQQGLDIDAALDWAKAIELLHNASLVHDDICDDDHIRRNRASLWAAFGQPTALCFGDWLIGKSFELAARAEAKSGKPFSALLARTMTELSTGQAMEFDKAAAQTLDLYLIIVAGKTTPLFMAAIEGAFLAGKAMPVEEATLCRKVFEHIGFAYQIANDIENHQALKAGADKGDLLRGAPNAVYICYRNLLNADKRAAFDHWQKSEAKHYADKWLRDIAASEAETQAYRLFDEHLQMVQQVESHLPPALRRLVAPIRAYLTGQ